MLRGKQCRFIQRGFFMNAVIQKRNISETEYLELEEHSNIKHEYINGEMWAMAGASRNHNILTGNVWSAFIRHLEGTRCIPFSADMKVKIENKNDSKFFYPDVVVACDDEDGNDYFTNKPRIIVEVLSKGTQQIDKSFKFNAYKTITTLQEYILISQDSAELMVCRRNNSWAAEFFFLGDNVTFESIGLTIAVETIYQRVKNQDVLDYLQQKAQQTETETCQ